MSRCAIVLALAAALATSPAAEEKLSPALEQARAAAEKRDFATAAKILRTEADKGDAVAANGLGELYMSGEGVKASRAEALAWFQRSADSGNPAGLFNTAGLLFAGGEGVARDEEKGRFLLRSAAEAGYAPAQAKFGKLLDSAANRADNAAGFAEARQWIEKAAAQNEPEALLLLARYHDEGMGGVERDALKATDFCLRAARAGSVVAMNEMGVRYQKGTGIRMDNVAAVGWVTLSAQHGLPAALVNLGNCYEVGNGVRQDFDQAGRNYSLAAKQKFAPAEFLLGQMIEQGKGTTANPANAYVLYTRAAAQKHEEAAKRAEALKSKLSAAELEAAGKLLSSGAVP